MAVLQSRKCGRLLCAQQRRPDLPGPGSTLTAVHICGQSPRGVHTSRVSLRQPCGELVDEEALGLCRCFSCSCFIVLLVVVGEEDENSPGNVESLMAVVTTLVDYLGGSYHHWMVAFFLGHLAGLDDTTAWIPQHYRGRIVLLQGLLGDENHGVRQRARR